MNQNMNQDDVNQLIGKKLIFLGSISKAEDEYCCVAVFEKRDEDSQKQKRWKLFMRSPWRIQTSSGTSILIGDGDYFEPASDVEWSDFQENRKEKPRRLLDELLEDFEFDYDLVVKVWVSAFYDLQIEFSNGCKLECFCNTSDHEWKGWRLEPGRP